MNFENFSIALMNAYKWPPYFFSKKIDNTAYGFEESVLLCFRNVNDSYETFIGLLDFMLFSSMTKYAFLNSIKHNRKLSRDVNDESKLTIIWCDEDAETIEYYKSAANQFNFLFFKKA